jgi:hypothetical protein
MKKPKSILLVSILAYFVIATILMSLLEAIGISTFSYGYVPNWADESLEFGESTTLAGWLVVIISIFPAKWIYDRLISKTEKKQVEQEKQTKRAQDIIMENQVTVIHSAHEDEPKVVAKVDVGNLSDMGALEYAFRSTNNIEGPWILNEHVKYLGNNPDEVRQTSVGDEMLYDGKRYRVDKYGFKLVTETS